jgi:signal transduction histidine kinase
MSAAAHDQAAIWLSSREDAEAHFPGFGAVMGHCGNQAYATLPLISAERTLGAMSFSYARPQTFAAEERAFLSALAQQCVQALERARLYGEVLAAHARLQQLSERLIVVQEEERQHLARELHDEIGQSLTGLNLSLTIGPTLSPDLLHAQMHKAQQQVTSLITQVRQRSLALRPAMLDDMGLRAALLWFFERYAEQTGIMIDMRLQGLERRFLPMVELTAYRIVQEALTNVARHAAVPRAHVAVWATTTTLLITIADTGRGFDVEAALRTHASSGLAGMRERAVLLGGDLTITAEPGAGTNVLAVLPIGRPGAAPEEIP